MGLLEPTPPPYDPIAWLGRPFAERARYFPPAELRSRQPWMPRA